MPQLKISGYDLVMNKILSFKMILTTAVLNLYAFSPTLADTIEPGKGQSIQDGTGNSFMDEVIDPHQKIKDEIERERAKQNRSLDRHLLDPNELRNVNMQVTKSGQLIPLINRNATSPVQQNTSNMEVHNETLPLLPIATPYGIVPYNPYVPTSPYYARPLPNIYQPYPYNPYYSGSGGFQGQIYSSPSYMSTGTSVFTDPTKPGSVSVSRDTLLNTPIGLQGYGINTPSGTRYGGSLLLPTETRSTSTTTYTPIIPDWAK